MIMGLLCVNGIYRISSRCTLGWTNHLRRGSNIVFVKASVCENLGVDGKQRAIDGTLKRCFNSFKPWCCSPRHVIAEIMMKEENETRRYGCLGPGEWCNLFVDCM